MTVASTQAYGLLGKLPAKADIRTLKLARYVDRATLPQPPDRLDLGSAVREWPMYANDRLGDCTCAAAGHMIEAWTAASRGQAAVITEAAVIEAFERVKVTDPVTGEEGAYELDVLKLWRRSGFGGHTIGAFAVVPPHDHRLVTTAAWLFGGLYVGVELPLTAQDQAVWDWTMSLEGDAAPGSWGGHAVDVVDYDETRLAVVTWGSLKEMTWAFWDCYVDEVYCLLSADFIDGGRAPNGFDLDALRADLRLITAS
jgi:hypothetical protein